MNFASIGTISYAVYGRIFTQYRTQSMPVRRLGHAQHLTCERAYSGYEIDFYADIIMIIININKMIINYLLIYWN
jgi:hypothetical protein